MVGCKCWIIGHAVRDDIQICTIFLSLSVADQAATVRRTRALQRGRKAAHVYT